MGRLIISLLSLVSIPFAAVGAETVFCGKSLGHKFIQGIEIPCPKDAICMGGWFRWKLHVDKVLTGPDVPRELLAVTLQHAQFTSEYEDRISLFAIKPIDDEAQRKLLGADYYYTRLSPGIAQNARACAKPSTN